MLPLSQFLSVVPTHAAEPFFETTLVLPNALANKPNYRFAALFQAPSKDLLVICEKPNDGPGDIAAGLPSSPFQTDDW